MRGIFTKIKTAELNLNYLVNMVISKAVKVHPLAHDVPVYWAMEPVKKQSLKNKFGL